MIALTQDKREELIEDCHDSIGRIERLMNDFPHDAYNLENALIKNKVVLASLTADIFAHVDGSGLNFYRHPSATIEYAIEQGDQVTALYAAPPVTEIKFPDIDTCDNGLRVHGLKNRVQGVSQTSDCFRCGFSWYERQFKRLNGLGE